MNCQAYPVYFAGYVYSEVYNKKYKEMYGNHYWVDRELDAMYLHTEEEDNLVKNHETFDFYDSWNLYETFAETCEENSAYKKLDFDIESNFYRNDEDEYCDTNDDNINDETFSDCLDMHYYNLFLDFNCACFDKYLENLCNINSCVEEDVSFDERNQCTFDFDRFRPVYEIV